MAQHGVQGGPCGKEQTKYNCLSHTFPHSTHLTHESHITNRSHVQRVTDLHDRCVLLGVGAAPGLDDAEKAARVDGGGRQVLVSP